MSEFKNSALGDALKGRMTKIVIVVPEEGVAEEHEVEGLPVKENSPRPPQKSK